MQGNTLFAIILSSMVHIFRLWWIYGGGGMDSQKPLDYYGSLIISCWVYGNLANRSIDLVLLDYMHFLIRKFFDKEYLASRMF